MSRMHDRGLRVDAATPHSHAVHPAADRIGVFIHVGDNATARRGFPRLAIRSQWYAAGSEGLPRKAWDPLPFFTSRSVCHAAFALCCARSETQQFEQEVTCVSHRPDSHSYSSSLLV